MNFEAIKTGDFLIIGFGNGTQGVKVIATTVKRLEIIRCQQYLSDAPFWTGAISKISRNDSRIKSMWQCPARIAAEAPSGEELAETKLIAKHKAACSRLANKAAKPFEHDEDDEFLDSGDHVTKTMQPGERRAWYVKRNAEASAAWGRQEAARKAVQAEYAAKHGRDAYGRKIIAAH